MGENFLLQPGSGEKFMDNLKAAPVGTTIRDGEGLIQHRKKGDNEWEWLNPTTGKVIMVGDDNSVFQAVRAATTSEAPRKTPAWPSTGHGSPGHKGEAWTMESPKDEEKRPEQPKGALTHEERQKLNDFRQMILDAMDMKRSKGEPIPDAYRHKLAETEARLKGEKHEAGTIAASQVFGHPSATTIGGEKYSNLIPIKVGDRATVDRYTDRAQKFVDDLQSKIGRADAIARGRMKGDKKKAKAYMGSAERTEDETVLDLLRSETLPELRRLHSALPEAASPTKEQAEKTAATVVGDMIGDFLKDGTKAGAARGWETRRGRAPVEQEREPSSGVPQSPGEAAMAMQRAARAIRQSGVTGQPKVPVSSVRVGTGKHRFSTGKEPMGLGLWMFQIGDKTEEIHGDYAEAKGKAVRMAAERGEREVEVLP